MHSAHSVPRFRSLLVLLVLTLLVAAPWPVHAGPIPRAEATASPIRLFIDWLAGLWEDNGCSFDPSGLCHDSTTNEPSSGSDGLDNGCSFDPGGAPCRNGR